VFGTHEPASGCEVVGVLAPTNSRSTRRSTATRRSTVDRRPRGRRFVVEPPPGKSPEDAKKLPVRATRSGSPRSSATKDHVGAQILRPSSAAARRAGGVASRGDEFLEQIATPRPARHDRLLVLAVATVRFVAIYNTMNERGARSRSCARSREAPADLPHHRRRSGAAVVVRRCSGAAVPCRRAAAARTVEEKTGLPRLGAFGAELCLVVGVGALGHCRSAPAEGSFTQVADNLAPSY